MCERCKELEKEVEQLESVVQDMVHGLEIMTGNARCMFARVVAARPAEEGAA